MKNWIIYDDSDLPVRFVRNEEGYTKDPLKAMVFKTRSEARKFKGGKEKVGVLKFDREDLWAVFSENSKNRVLSSNGWGWKTAYKN